ncbi:MAG TPA: hypothetical protein PLV25_07315, partial [Opitutales bacterium]|nr:hypothetical protein [Opitutales bacterium]
HIRVVSIVDRFLEHSRIFYFLNHGNDPKIYLGSADWMPRNFYTRVETVFPVLDPEIRSYIINEVISRYLMDNQDAMMLDDNGHYNAVICAANQRPLCAQAAFIEEAESRRLITAFEREEKEETT